MNTKMRPVFKMLTITLVIMVALQGCGKSKKNQETTVSATLETTISCETTENANVVEAEAQASATETTGENFSETDPATTKKKNPENEVPETTEPPIIIMGGNESDEATEETIPLEERPVVTTPVIQEEETITDYERYLAMSGEEQQRYMQSFSSVEAFFAWFTSAKEEYENAHPNIEISGDEVIQFN